ncbi:MAG: hypothetical protein FWD34_00190 [Oscillospiraceae bacterium]|nr:hypothetical protein [Oscillospiraceae bacterium]
MQMDRINQLMAEIVNEINAAEKKNRDLYHSAIDIEDDELSHKTQAEAFQALRKMKGLKSAVDTFQSQLKTSGLEFSQAAPASPAQPPPPPLSEVATDDSIDFDNVDFDSDDFDEYEEDEEYIDDEEDSIDQVAEVDEIIDDLGKFVGEINDEPAQDDYEDEDDVYSVDFNSTNEVAEEDEFEEEEEVVLDAIEFSYDSPFYGNEIGVDGQSGVPSIFEENLFDNDEDIAYGNEIEPAQEEFPPQVEPETEPEPEAYEEEPSVDIEVPEEFAIEPEPALPEAEEEPEPVYETQPEPEAEIYEEEPFVDIEIPSEFAIEAEPVQEEPEPEPQEMQSTDIEIPSEFAIESEPTLPDLPSEAEPVSVPEPEPVPELPVPDVGIYSNRTPVSFTMFTRKVAVHDWQDMLVKICEILILKSPYVVAQFDKYQDLNPLNQIYFSYNQADIKYVSRKLSNGLWLEAHRSADDTVMLCKKLLEICGYARNELEIEFSD